MNLNLCIGNIIVVCTGKATGYSAELKLAYRIRNASLKSVLVTDVMLPVCCHLFRSGWHQAAASSRTCGPPMVASLRYQVDTNTSLSITASTSLILLLVLTPTMLRASGQMLSVSLKR